MYKQHKQKQKLFIFSLILCIILAGIYSSLNKEKSVSALTMQGKTVVIDPGHGGNDPGCIHRDKIMEKNITLMVARELAQMLEMEGATVRLTRDGDYQPGQKLFFWKRKDNLDERIAIAQKNKADILLSLHINSSPKTNKAGAVVFYNQTKRLDQRLAQNIQQELIHIPDMVKRTSHARNYYILNHLEIPAAAVELGYISNDKDRQHLVDAMYHEKLARSICTGIVNYFNDSREAVLSEDPEIPIPDRDNNIQANEANMDILPNLYFVPKIKTRLFIAAEEMDPVDMANTSVEKLARFALEQLADGPRQTKDLRPCIPDGIAFNDFKVSGSLATVDLSVTSEKPGYISSEEEWAAVSSISYTLFELPVIQQVQISINGQQSKTLAGHIDISEPLSRNKLPLTKVAGGIMEGKKAKVAIVIDDFGQSNPGGAKEMLSLDRPLTFAIMPNHEYSRQQAMLATKHGYEVIVHLPMQPVRGKPSWLGPGAITSNMTAEEIRQQVRRDFAQVPYASGFNNHMGSLITAREELIRPVLEVAREEGFYVLDSKTSDNSKIIPLAKSMGIAYTKRDVFLDEIKNVAHMKKQLDLLADEALANGSAVGIGHVGMGGEKMARAIKEMIPAMETKGIEFIYLSELVY